MTGRRGKEEIEIERDKIKSLTAALKCDNKGKRKITYSAPPNIKHCVTEAIQQTDKLFSAENYDADIYLHCEPEETP